jgi:hypothetical protein
MLRVAPVRLRRVLRNLRGTANDQCGTHSIWRVAVRRRRQGCLLPPLACPRDSGDFCLVTSTPSPFAGWTGLVPWRSRYSIEPRSDPTVG